MLSLTWLILIFIILMLLSSIFYLIFLNKKKKLHPQKKKYFHSLMIKIKKSSNWKDQIIELDKLLHHIFLAYWLKWTFWEILKEEPPLVKWELQNIWKYHKLRNTLVHDFSPRSNNELLKSSKDYSKIIKEILSEL